MITHPVLSALAARGVRLGLDDTRAFLGELGDPHLARPVLHVAGTNGKGSTTAMLTAALKAAGRSVGTNTSPHLEHLNERFRLDGVPVDDARLEALVARLDAQRRAHATRHGLAQPPLTYFEFCTVLAFQLFADEAVDAAVVEVGLGGRLDATNVVDPTVCGITSIGLDHTDQLGDTLAAIAGEKAGILKPDRPAVVGPMDTEAAAAIADRAAEVGAPVWWVGRDVVVERAPGGVRIATPAGVVGPVELGLAGVHQEGNAAVAVGMLHLARDAGMDVPDEAIAAGLRDVRLPGRIERLAPDVVADGAHNGAGATAFARWLGEHAAPGRRILLLGMGAERVPMDVVGPLAAHVDAVWTTRCAHPKASTPQALAAALDVDVPVVVAGDVEEALPAARAAADEVVVAGSLYLVGAARSLISP